MTNLGNYLANRSHDLLINEEDVAAHLGYRCPARMVRAWRKGLGLPRPADFKRVAEALDRPPVEVILHVMLDEAPDLAPEIGDALERLGMYAPSRIEPARPSTKRNLSVEDPHDRNPGDADHQV
jgi:hypothetical protein